jgi:hypothetical protein
MCTFVNGKIPSIIVTDQTASLSVCACAYAGERTAGKAATTAAAKRMLRTATSLLVDTTKPSFLGFDAGIGVAGRQSATMQIVPGLSMTTVAFVP